MIMSAQTHLVHQFDEDLDELKHLLYSMGDLVTEPVSYTHLTLPTNSLV